MPNTPVAAFYHCWVDGECSNPREEFGAALEQPGFPGERFFNCSHATSEAPTINLVRAYAQDHDGVVLYAHTKGAATVSPFRDRWRRSMTARVVANWRENLTILERGDVDAVGCHWLTPEEYPDQVRSPFFGGNFWMARCDYLRTLPPCEAEPRWKAEGWIGLGCPRVVDLLPGWPHDNRWPELCG